MTKPPAVGQTDLARTQASIESDDIIRTTFNFGGVGFRRAPAKIAAKCFVSSIIMISFA